MAPLQQLNAALTVTLYRSGRLNQPGRDRTGGLMENAQILPKAMALHYREEALCMKTQAPIHGIRNILRAEQVIDSQFTDCFMPRSGHLTGVSVAAS